VKLRLNFIFAFKILTSDLELEVKNGSQILQIQEIFSNIINLLNLPNLREPKNKKKSETIVAPD